MWWAKINFASYWVIIDVAQTYRIPSDSLFITTLSIIDTYHWAWECACIVHLYWNWYDAIGFVTLSLIQCIYVLKCRVIICLDNRFMNVRPQVPQHSPEQTQFIFIIPFNPHPVMSSDLHGPPTGPRRPGTMIFKCVEFLVQLKNKNSSYWLSHITTALNCKMCLIF